LNHPHICALYDVGADYLVMELVEGPTLADRIAAGRIPVPEALAIARQIAEALEAAHEKGIVHRDLKSANVKVTPEGVVKVLDFSLAKSAEESTSAAADATNFSDSHYLAHARWNDPGHGRLHESRAGPRGRGGQAVGRLGIRSSAL